MFLFLLVNLVAEAVLILFFLVLLFTLLLRAVYLLPFPSWRRRFYDDLRRKHFVYISCLSALLLVHYTFDKLCGVILLLIGSARYFKRAY